MWASLPIPSSPAANYDNWQRAITRGRTVTVPKGDIYLDPKGDGPLSTPARVSCGRVEVPSAGGCAVKPNPFTGQMATRILWQDDGPFLHPRLGLRLGWPSGNHRQGQGGVCRSGRSLEPATGRHQINGPHFRNWAVAIRALGGYYERGKFIADDETTPTTRSPKTVKRGTAASSTVRISRPRTGSFAAGSSIRKASHQPLWHSTLSAADSSRRNISCHACHCSRCFASGLLAEQLLLAAKEISSSTAFRASRSSRYSVRRAAVRIQPGFDMGYIKWHVKTDGWIALNDQLEFNRVSIPEFMQQKAKPIDTSDVVWEEIRWHIK